VIYAVLVQSVRSLRARSARGRPYGLFLSRAVPCICAILVVVRLCASPLGIELTNSPPNWANYQLGNYDRARVDAVLARSEGKFLVVVRYSAHHNPEDEWVFNGADIDHAKIVWAREREQGNEPLVDYFHDRHIYLIEPDRDRTRLEPYVLPQSLP
jgi:hypothetical protein